MTLYVVFRLAFGAVFVWASWDKLLYPQAFADVISNYKILPGFLINPVAVILPWTEMVCGVSLVVGFVRGGSLLTLNGLLLIFLMALALSLYRGLDISCGCFSLGQDGEKIALETLARDAVLLIFGIWLGFLEFKRSSSRKTA